MDLYTESETAKAAGSNKVTSLPEYPEHVVFFQCFCQTLPAFSCDVVGWETVTKTVDTSWYAHCEILDLPKLMYNITTRLMAYIKVFTSVVYLFLFIFPLFAMETKRQSFIYFETFIECIGCNINHVILGNNLYEKLVLIKKILLKNSCFKRPDRQLPIHNEFLEGLHGTTQINYITHLV